MWCDVMARWSVVCPSRCLTGLLECASKGEMEHSSMTFCSRGQLVKHRYSVCLLMHVGAAQGRPPLQERQRVRPAAAQVRDACNMMPAFPI